MRVKNLNGASRRGSSGTWLALWEKVSGLNAFLCFVKDCIERPAVGGLVQKDSPHDKNWYVIPLCGPCNARSGEDLAIWDEARLIPAHDIEAVSIPLAPFQNIARWGPWNIQLQ